MKRFIINAHGVYYMTRGELLEYNHKDAKGEKQGEGVDKVKELFRKELDSAETAYVAVEVKDPRFTAVNTGP